MFYLFSYNFFYLIWIILQVQAQSEFSEEELLSVVIMKVTFSSIIEVLYSSDSYICIKDMVLYASLYKIVYIFSSLDVWSILSCLTMV